MEESHVYGQKNFNLPHDVVKLPSGGIFYNSKKKAVKVGYLTASDENIIMAGNSLKEGVILTLLRNKIYEPDLRPEELLQGDIQAILIFLRNSAFGPEYDMNVLDPETGKYFSTTILLDELEFRKTESEPNEDGTYSTILPKSGYSVKLKPLSFRDIESLDKMAENYPQNRVAPKQTWRLQKTIVEINGISDLGQLSQQIELLPIADSKYIKQFMDKNEPGLNLTRKVMAPSGRELSVDIAFGVEFFRPFF